jgi:HNH endonuclease
VDSFSFKMYAKLSGLLSKGGSDDESNLWLACPVCNGHKSDKIQAVDCETGETVALFNPRQQRWADHFQWLPNGIQIEGKTSVGRATVVALHLDIDPDALEVRSYWVQAGWHPPKD